MKVHNNLIFLILVFIFSISVNSQELSPDSLNNAINRNIDFEMSNALASSPVLSKYVAIIKLNDEKEKYNKIDSLLKNSYGPERFYILAYACKISFNTNHYSKAKHYSEELLKLSEIYKKDWNFGNAIHDGNMVLGRLSLLNNNISEAEDYLIKAGNTPGSPQLNTFGPNMALAKDLLTIGQRQIVIKYFDLCSRFWSMGREKIADWKKEIEKEKIPDFGANLRY
ncbi:MAG: hypothetical protein ACYC6P_15835 [Ignavibacteriaceae bacterium]